MAEPPETIMEERETLMVSPKGGNPISTVAHFIKPILGVAHSTPERPLISLPFRPISLNVTLNGWSNPSQQWISWVNHLHSSHKFIWKRAGIYEAILSSTYKIIKNEDLVFGLAERWCSETNTFVFPWGETTITLEDVMVLGGYPVLGDSLSGFVDDRISGFVDDRNLALIEEKLIQEFQEISKRNWRRVNPSLWINHFMGSESQIEHEAFLSLWLSRFVLPTYPFNTISKKFFKLAIFLARGTQIALAPVVLANLYRDLSLLKSAMESNDGCDDLVEIKITLWAPLQLVQVWAWERFPEFRPNPSAVEYGEPRFAKWHNVNENDIGNVRPMLQSSGHTFEWRPYCVKAENLPLPAFYREQEERVFSGPNLGEDIQSLARFMRVCELVGIDSIEQYNPHRVAMQFGFDQDIPEHVRICLNDRDLAWLSYIEPIRDQIFYIPSKFYEPKVTIRYLEWHRAGLLTRLAAFDGVVRKRRSSKRLRKSQALNINVNTIADNDADVPPGFMAKTILKNDCNDFDFPPGFPPKFNGLVKVKKECFESDESCTPSVTYGKGAEMKYKSSHDSVGFDLEACIRHLVEEKKAKEVEKIKSNGLVVLGMSNSVVKVKKESLESDEIYPHESVGLDLEARIRQLDRIISSVKGAKSAS